MHANYNSSSSEDEIPFPDTLLIPDVNPSYDLVNEPFSWDDSGVRPDIRSQGSKYFECETLKDGHAVCRAGRVEIGSVGEEPVDINSYPRARVSTNTSLIDIYNWYGLPAMYLHLRCMYDCTNIYRTHIYVAGSLALINPKYAQSLTMQKNDGHKAVGAATCALVSQLILELLYLDSLQPCLSEPLTTVTVALPDDILARIVGGRVSKALREKWLAYKCSLPILIREGEMEAKANLPHVVLTKTRFISVGADRWRTITPSTGGMFMLSLVDMGMGLQARHIGNPVVWSPRDYTDVYKSRGGDGVAAVREMLWSSHSIESVCAWTIQLATELEDEWPAQEVTEAELRALFETLRARFWLAFMAVKIEN